MARPQDIGEQFPSDAVILDLPDVHEGRAQIDYGTRPETSEAFIPAKLATISTALKPVRQFVIFLDADEYVICREVLLDADSVEYISTPLVFIAKPTKLRASDYDGLEDTDGFTQTKVTSSRRQLVRDTLTKFQIVYPPYSVSSRIFASNTEGTSVTGVTLIDMNFDSRRWVADQPATKYFQIVDIDKDTFDCQEWDFSTNAQKVDSPETLIAKHVNARGSTWHGETIDDVEYAAVGGTTESDPFVQRTGTDETEDPEIVENQEITPPWFTDITIIRAVYIEDGTGALRNNIQAIWQDANDGGHAFGEIFA